MRKLSTFEVSYRNFAFAYSDDIKKLLMNLKNQISKGYYEESGQSIGRLRDIVCHLESVNDKLLNIEE